MAIDSLWSSYRKSLWSKAGLLDLSDLNLVYVQCHLFMPDAYFFSGEGFMASVHARTALGLQGGRRHLERLDILQDCL